MSLAKSKWRYFVSGFAWTLVVIILGLVAVAFVVPKLTGSTSITVLSDSMQPTFGAGDLLVVKTVSDPSSLVIGDVVTFHPEANSSYLVTHRIIGKEVNAEGLVGLVTQGDANPAVDDPISPNQVVAKYQYHLPYLGTVADWVVKNRLWLVIGAVVLVLAGSGWDRWKKKSSTNAPADEPPADVSANPQSNPAASLSTNSPATGSADKNKAGVGLSVIALTAAFAILPAVSASADNLPDGLHIDLSWNPDMSDNATRTLPIFPSLEVVPGDIVSETIYVRNQGPTAAVLTAEIINLDLGVNPQNPYYEEFLVGGIPLSELVDSPAAGVGVFYETELQPGQIAPVAITYEHLASATDGQIPVTEDVHILFDVRFKLQAVPGIDPPIIDPPGGSGTGGSGFLPKTGAEWMTLAGVATALLGAGWYLLHRRRQLKD